MRSGESSSGRMSSRLGDGSGPRSLSSGQLVEVPASASVGAAPIGDTWISGAGDKSGAEQDATREEQIAAAQGQSGVRGGCGMVLWLLHHGRSLSSCLYMCTICTLACALAMWQYNSGLPASCRKTSRDTALQRAAEY